MDLDWDDAPFASVAVADEVGKLPVKAATTKSSASASGATCFCSARRCGLCTWQRLGEKWRSVFLLDPNEPQRGSWLDARVAKGLWGLGCTVCASADVKSAFARFSVRFVQKSELEKHEASEAHQRATGSVPPRALNTKLS